MTHRILFPLVLLSTLLLASCASGGAAPGVADARAPAPAPAPVAPVAPAQLVVETGTLEAAPYRIDIPANWNGELVVNAHGYEVVGQPRKSPMTVPGGMQALLDAGFALAASDYSAQGWAIGEAVADTERLRAHFVARHGRPTHTWLVGWSMGGLVALASAERHPRAYDGVAAMCPVAASSEAMIADGALRPLAAFDALFPGVLPPAPRGLADPSLPVEADGDAIEAALAGDARKATAFAQRFDLPRDEAAGALWLYYTALRELVERAGGFPVASVRGDAGVDGDEAALGVSIRRYTEDPAAAAFIRRTGALTGAAPIPVIVQGNATDPIVPVRITNTYAALAQAAGRGAQVRTLAPVGDGHCRFQPTAVVAALDALRVR